VWCGVFDTALAGWEVADSGDPRKRGLPVIGLRRACCRRRIQRQRRRTRQFGQSSPRWIV
jgi:hypothetical protein